MPSGYDVSICINVCEGALRVPEATAIQDFTARASMSRAPGKLQKDTKSGRQAWAVVPKVTFGSGWIDAHFPWTACPLHRTFVKSAGLAPWILEVRFLEQHFGLEFPTGFAYFHMRRRRAHVCAGHFQ